MDKPIWHCGHWAANNGKGVTSGAGSEPLASQPRKLMVMLCGDTRTFCQSRIHSLTVFLLSLTHLAENSVSKTESQRARDEQKRKVRLEDNCTDDQIWKQHILLCRQKHCSLLIWRVRLPSRLCRRPLRRQNSSVERFQALGSENQFCLELLGFHA